MRDSASKPSPESGGYGELRRFLGKLGKAIGAGLDSGIKVPMQLVS